MIKVGLALGGGVFRGMAHIGVLQVLEENQIPVDLIAGTSMGALIGGIYSCGVAPRMILQIAQQLNMLDYYDISIPKDGLIKGDRVLTLLRTLTGNRTFAQTKLPFSAVAVDIESGDMVVLEEGRICDAIRASISIPGIFVPHRLEGRRLCDGGLIDRVPVSVARQMGADVTIGVDVGYRKGYRQHTDGIFSLLLRAFDIMEWELAKARMNTADVLLTPDLKYIDYTTLKNAEEAVQLGRDECERQLPAIREAIRQAEERLAPTLERQDSSEPVQKEKNKRSGARRKKADPQ